MKVNIQKRKGIFRSILKFHGKKNESVGSVILKNDAGNCIMYSPNIQKDIVNACSRETIDAIIEEIGDGYFSMLTDESHDVNPMMSRVNNKWPLF